MLCTEKEVLLAWPDFVIIYNNNGIFIFFIIDSSIMNCFFIDTWRVHYLEIGGMVRTFVSNDVVLHQSTEMQQMMQLTISEARKEWNEDTTCDDPILVRECQ